MKKQKTKLLSMISAEERLDKKAKAAYRFHDQSVRAVKFSDALLELQKVRKEGEQKCIREGKLHVTDAFLDAKIEEARKEEQDKAMKEYSQDTDKLFKQAKNINKKQDDLRKLFIESMDSQDPNHNTNSWEKELAKVEARVHLEIAEIFNELELKNLIPQEGFSSPTAVNQYNEIKKRFLSKPQSDKEVKKK